MAEKKKPVINETHEEAEKAQYREWAAMTPQERFDLMNVLLLQNLRKFNTRKTDSSEGFELKRKS